MRSTLVARLFWEVERGAVYVTVVVSALFLGFAGCAPKPLPELSRVPGEQLYAGRCGGCHRPYLPSTMTSAMWAEQVEAMQSKMTQAGVAPLSDSERREILDYLERNAGKD
jgi:mono/diheme cytochrome c family protein